LGYTKWWNHLKGSIQAIDVALGTHFYEELEALVTEEKKMFKEVYGDNNPSTPSVHIDSSAPSSSNSVAAPRASAPRIDSPEEAKASTQSHSVDKLPADQKAQVATYGFNPTGEFYITYNSDEKTIGCTICKTPSPKSFTQCPKCGVNF
jgi:hypothetical protein